MRIAILFLALAFSLSGSDQALRWMAEGRYQEAHDLLRRLIREGNENGAGPEYRAGLQQMLSVAANSLGRYAEGQQEAERGVALLEQAGASSPGSARIVVSLLVAAAEAHSAQAHFAEAETTLRRAQAVASAKLSADDPRQAEVHDGLGNLWLSQGQLPRAERSFRAALRILETQLGPSHPDIAPPALALASILTARKKPVEALVLIERSLGILERTRGPAHPTALAARTQFGLAQVESDPAAAERVLRAVLDTWATTQPDRHVFLATILSGLAAARFRQSDPAGAVEFGARALAILRESVGPQHPQSVDLMMEQSRLLRAAKRKKEAATLAAEADRIRKTKGYSGAKPSTIDIRTLTPKRFVPL